MQRQQLHMLQLQVAHRLLEGLAELARIGEGRDFRLHDHLFARQARQDVAELHLAAAVAARGFDVIDTQVQCPQDGGFQIALARFLDRLRVDVVPRLLVAHPPAGKHGHLKIRATEATGLHRGIYMALPPADNEDRTRKKRAPGIFSVLAVLTVAWRGWSHSRTNPVQAFPPPPVAPADRVATARYW